MLEINKIHQGDCLELMKEMPDNSVDSIVTDPPYGLSFMGNKWDYDVPSVEIWKECLRVLKPGGYLLSFAGTRTQHRMCVNIEDAGFEIRDMIAWVYGSGFPKSHNIGKAIDKLQGNEREFLGIDKTKYRKDNDNNNTYAKHCGQTGKITKGNSPYEGWGTALKPALEPITVARKPFKGTVANNVLKYGTGGINIDGCRVETGENLGRPISKREEASSVNAYNWSKYKNPQAGQFIDNTRGQGRFPANLIHDGSDEVVGLFPKNIKGEIGRAGRKSAGDYEASNYKIGVVTKTGFNDKGSAARFFYCAKASKKERNEGCEGLEEKQYSHDGRNKEIENAYQRNKSVATNNHPTVKPIKLMQYLVRLVTPKDGVCLDPFMGSGSTGKACKLEGFNYIGIELNEEYVKIAQLRNKLKETEEQRDLISFSHKELSEKIVKLNSYHYNARFWKGGI